MKSVFSNILTVAFFGVIAWLIYSDAIRQEQESPNAINPDYQQPIIAKTESLHSDAQLLSQNDLMMNIVANPTFSLEDFVAIGISKDNVSLRDIQIYRDDPYIKSIFTDELGNLNEMRLQSVYHKAIEWFERLQNENIHTDDPSYHRDNIFAPSEQRRQGHDYEELIKTE